MSDVILAFAVFASLFILLLLSVIIGRCFGRRQFINNPENKLQVISVAESAVFALLGLLIAFTFSEAYQRFELRKTDIIQEVNAIETTYLRIGLLAPENQPGLRETLLQYLDARIAIYKEMTDLHLPTDSYHKYIQIRTKIWDETLAALATCKTTTDQASTMLFIPAVNSMFEIANTRFAIASIHSPIAIFVLLIGLAVLASFLAGYRTGGKKGWNLIYILSYVIITSFTIYIIVDLEFPRLGLIRVDSFDQILIDLKANLK